MPGARRENRLVSRIAFPLGAGERCGRSGADFHGIPRGMALAAAGPMAPISDDQSDPEAPSPSSVDGDVGPGVYPEMFAPVAPVITPAILSGMEKRVAAGSVIAGGMLTLLILMTRAGASAAPPPNPTPTPAPVATQPAGTAADAGPGWSDENSDTWVAGSRGAVAFEVSATKPVALWMRTATPVLVVRCEGKVLDVFVFTDSAARIESNTLDHTVRFQFDEGDETSALWPDADTHDALFAPNGAGFAQRIAAARTLRFGFTPHNAEPVSMQFPVAGLAPILARAAKAGCRAPV